jgi:hypothetical protein
MPPFAACSGIQLSASVLASPGGETKMARSITFTLFFYAISLACPASAQDTVWNPAELHALASSWAGNNIPGGSAAAGYRLGGAWRPNPDVSLVADVSHNFVSDQKFSLTSLLAGPRFYSNQRYRTSGYWQVMFGAQRSAAPGQPAEWNFVFAPGVGVDIRLTDHLTFRPLELELTLSKGNGLLRASSGFAFRFGH